MDKIGRKIAFFSDEIIECLCKSSSCLHCINHLMTAKVTRSNASMINVMTAEWRECQKTRAYEEMLKIWLLRAEFRKEFGAALLTYLNLNGGSPLVAKIIPTRSLPKSKSFHFDIQHNGGRTQISGSVTKHPNSSLKLQVQIVEQTKITDFPTQSHIAPTENATSVINEATIIESLLTKKNDSFQKTTFSAVL